MTIRAGVYEIVNTINGNCYIGSSINLKKRFRDHQNDLYKQKHRNAHLQKAWVKYGEKSYIFRVLLYCDPEMTIIYEQMCIDGLHPEYNIAPIAGNNSGTKRSEETKQKLSEAHKGISQSKELVQKRVDARKGYTHSEETKKKISDSHIGKTYSEETLHNMSEGQKKRFSKEGSVTEETRVKLSFAAKGRKCGPMSEVQKKKISISRKGIGLGVPHSDEWNRRISESHKGHLLSEEHKQRMSETRKGKPMPERTEEHRHNLSEAAKIQWAKKRGEL